MVDTRSMSYQTNSHRIWLPDIFDVFERHKLGLQKDGALHTPEYDLSVIYMVSLQPPTWQVSSNLTRVTRFSVQGMSALIKTLYLLPVISTEEIRRL